ncbi:hypothetical protein GCM10028805_07910 [Spirosoma harenae]
MMRLFLLVILLLSLVLPGHAQERVRNVRIRVVDAERLEILYDLTNSQSGDSVYVTMRSRLRGPLRILPEFVRGDIGMNVTSGTDRRIVWEALANGYRLDEEVQARVFVKTGTIPASTTPSKPVVTAPIATQPSPSTTSKPEPVATKPEPSKSVAVAEPQPAASQPAAVTLTPPRSRRERRAEQSKPSIFAADPAQPEPASPAVVTNPVPATQSATSQTATTPVVQTNPPTVTTSPPVVTTDTVKARKARYAGPAWALVSVIAPGVGNIFVQTPKPKIGLRPLMAVGCYGLIAYGLMERKKAQDEYAIYEDQKNLTAAEPYYQTANDHHHRYMIATRGAIVVAAADVILTFIKGLRNVNAQKAAQQNQPVSIRPGIQAGQPKLVLRYSF